MSSTYRWAPAFKLVPDASSPPSGGLAIAVFTPVPPDMNSALSIGLHQYRCLPCRTGSSQELIGSPITMPVTTTLAGQAIKIVFPANPAIGAWHVWHLGPGAETAGEYWYSGMASEQPDGTGKMVFYDRAGGGISGVPIPAPQSWGTRYTIQLSPYTNTGAVRPGQLDITADVESLQYLELSDDSERQLLDRSIRRRERGVQARVKLRLRAPAGSISERYLALIYGAKLQWPNIETYFTLNYDQANTAWRRAVVVGDYNYIAVGGAFAHVEQDWTVIATVPLTTIPAIWPERTGRQPW